MKRINSTFFCPVSQGFTQSRLLFRTLWQGIGNEAAEQSADNSGWLESLERGALGMGREPEL